MTYALRTGAGVGLALLVTGTMALGVIVLATLYKLAIEWWAPWQNPFELAPRLWAWVVYEGCYRRLLGIDSDRTSNVDLPVGERITLCIANHPATAAVPAFIRYLTAGSRTRVIFVAKAEHLWNIFLGLPLLLINSAIFIRRSDHHAALGAIRQGLRKRFRRQTLLVIFPDQHRPTPERIEADRERFAGRVPGVERWLIWTLVPRNGGLHEILQTLAPRTPVINLTHTLGTCRYGLKDALRVAHETYRVERVLLRADELPHTRDELRAWLNDEWRRKNGVLHSWVIRPIRVA